MNKHILFIIENSSVPNDVRVWREALAAKDLDFDVSVISAKEGMETLSYESLEGIDIYRHPVPVGSKGKIAYLIEYANALFWEFFLALKIYIKKPFHIIHAGNPPDTTFLIAFLFRILGVKFVYDIHDLSPELYLVRFSGKKNRFYKLLIFAEKLSCKLADAIITANKSYREIVMNRHKKDPKMVFVVRNDPVVEEFLERGGSVRKKETDKKVILYLGTINPQDGVDILLSSLDYLIHKLQEKNFICFVVGDGQSLPVLKETASALNLEHYVDFKGYIYDRGKIREYLDLADVCVEPAPDNDLNRHSTFIKVMEYMASMKPIVAFDLMENRYSADGSAILVSPGDVPAFAEAIKKLLDDPELRKELGKKGAERIRDQLNWENASINLINAYKSLSL